MRKESQLNGKESQQLLTFIDNNGQNNTRTTKLSKNYQCILIMLHTFQ